MNIKIKRIALQNFKGCKDMSIRFEDRPVVTISGANATGKTTIIDALLWILFDKDSSGNSKFGIRPVDKNGNDVDNLEILASVTYEVDGKEITFCKTQKQKWTKHRGSSAPTFEGNVNSFEIDGFPQSKAEYQKRIAEILPEETFRLVADLRYFSGLDWKEKRKLLLSLCGDITDEDVLNDDPDHWKLARDDIEAAGVEKSREKAKKGLKELNQRQKEIPVRIDEITRSVQEVPDTKTAEADKVSLETRLAEVSKRIETLESDATVSLLKKQFCELDAKRHGLVNAENERVRKEYEAAQDRVSENLSKLFGQDKLIREITVELDNLNSWERAKSNELNYLAEQYKANENPIPLDENAKICPSCGQTLPPDKLKEIVEKHNANEAKRAEAKKEALEKGKFVKGELNGLRELIAKKKNDLVEAQAERDSIDKFQHELVESTNRLPKEADKDSIPGYAEVTSEINRIESKLKETETVQAELDTLKREKIDVSRRITELVSEISWTEAVKKTNEEAQNRIMELTDEQRSNGQMIADAEQKLVLLEEFSMRKSELLSKKITSCFEVTNFSLFNQQINGGLVEECEITLNGVKFKDMNNGHRIVVAMDIIKAFSNKLGVHAPLFIDNAESVNDFNLPEMPCQLILLKVSNDSKLTIEGGEIR